MEGFHCYIGVVIGGTVINIYRLIQFGCCTAYYIRGCLCYLGTVYGKYQSAVANGKTHIIIRDIRTEYGFIDIDSARSNTVGIGHFHYIHIRITVIHTEKIVEIGYGTVLILGIRKLKYYFAGCHFRIGTIGIGAAVYRKCEVSAVYINSLCKVVVVAAFSVIIVDAVTPHIIIHSYAVFIGCNVNYRIPFVIGRIKAQIGISDRICSVIAYILFAACGFNRTVVNQVYSQFTGCNSCIERRNIT